MYPGVTNTGFTEQIHAMVSTPTLPVTITKKTRIAQLVLFKSYVPKTDSRKQGDQGFRSTGQPGELDSGCG